MCCCEKSNINGESGYSWNGKSFGIHKPCFAEMEEGDELIRDLPGRCSRSDANGRGGIDSHSFDLRLVKRHGQLVLLINHGGGSECLELRAYGGAKPLFEAMSEADAYWTMATLYHVQKDAARNAQNAEATKWRQAAADKRIKTRKQRNGGFVKVWIESKTATLGV